MLPAATSILLAIALVHLVHPLLAAAFLDPAPDIARSRGGPKTADVHPERQLAAKFEDFGPAGRQYLPEGLPGAAHDETAISQGRHGPNRQEETQKARTKREPERKRRIKILPLLCG
ncbi:uncharacterized protein LOC108905409 [Anoplophora glabripennis]|uniref:uncharacterized protein LOC108905409 n=1 Tax=Anoplophora glabripennis TaxID=217634 RepID=UPI00087364C3|nr:uncharacterized protein LOC108905409 [Anoplophora glabripennis]